MVADWLTFECSMIYHRLHKEVVASMQVGDHIGKRRLPSCSPSTENLKGISGLALARPQASHVLWRLNACNTPP
jgi:hypothetical protein